MQSSIRGWRQGVSGELPEPGANGTGAGGTAGWPWPAWTAQAASQANMGLRSSLGEAGSTWGPTGLGGCWAHGGQRPAGAQPYLASMPESWAVARLSPGGRQLPPQVWVLGAWGVKGDTEGTY